jgi:lipopolysaccharide export system permease protein
MKRKSEHPVAGLLTRPWWKLSLRIWGYITREAMTPFVMALVVIMFVFLLQFLMRFIDKIVGKGLDLWTILQLIAFNLAWMVVLAVPMAVLVACVMAFGSLAASNELTALKAAGVSLGRMIFPVLVLGILIAAFDLQFNNNVLPDANHRAKDLMSDIQRKKPTLAIEPGRFTDDDEIPGYSILARRAVPNTSDLEDVTIYDHSQPSEIKVMTAEKAHLAFTSDFRNIILTLKQGEVHQTQAQAPADYRRGRFSTYIVQVPTSGYDFMRQGESERSDRELSANDLMRYVHNRDTVLHKQIAAMQQHVHTYAEDLTSPKPPTGQLQADLRTIMKTGFQSRLMTVQNDLLMIDQTDNDIDSYMVEVHKKYAIPVACIIFVLIGVPLGALAKRSGVGAGVGLSIGFFVLYWIFLIGGEKLADRAVITPFWGMWGGNILLALVGVYLTWRAAVEAPPLKITQWTKEFVRRFRKKNVRNGIAAGMP